MKKFISRIHRTILLSVVFLWLIIQTVFSATTEGKTGLLPLGSLAPDFKLQDVVSEKTFSRDDFKDKKALLVIFVCRSCPYVQNDIKGIVRLARDYTAKDISIVSISSNDAASYKEDAPKSLKEMVIKEGFPFVLLYDESQKVAKAYTAVGMNVIFRWK